MKNGTNIWKKRMTFFEIVSSNSDYCEKVQNVDNTKFAIIYKDVAMDIILGISRCGECVFIDKTKVYMINNKNEFMYCSKLVEIPYNLIIENMHNEFVDLMCLDNFNMSEIFPFFEIVEFVFNNLINDYWIDLAWLWYQNFSIVEKNKLVDALQNLINEKRISQNKRQEIKKEYESILKMLNK